MHMELSPLPSAAIASFHIHPVFISVWAIQVGLPLLGRRFQRGPACLPAVFLRSRWNRSAVALRWIATGASQSLLWLRPLSAGCAPPCKTPALPQQFSPQEGELSPILNSSLLAPLDTAGREAGRNLFTVKLTNLLYGAALARKSLIGQMSLE